jgi:hypothetical protein
LVTDVEVEIADLSMAHEGRVACGVETGTRRYGTLSTLVGVDPTDDVPGLPPVDSNDFWQVAHFSALVGSGLFRF